MSNDRILRTLQQDVEIPEVVRKKADQAFARIHAEQEKTEPDNRKVVSYNKKETERKAISKRKIAVVAAVAALATATVTAGAAAYMKGVRVWQKECRQRRYSRNSWRTMEWQHLPVSPAQMRA